jgi:hypothetical protein
MRPVTFKALVALALVLALAGCFRSEKPLIDEAQAAFPFEELTLKTEDGETAILRKAGNVYAYIDPDRPDRPADKSILLHKVAEQLYVVQEAGENGRSLYLFARRTGERVMVTTICRGVDDAVLAKVGLERESGGDFADCVAKELRSLTELAKAPELWANETKTLEIVSIK